MPAAAHKLSISFGLVNIPVNLYKAVSEDRVSFNQIHAPSGQRIRYKKVVAGTDNEVQPSEIIKGFEVEKGKYVTFTDDEIEQMRSKKDKMLSIERFVPIGSIDPIYYNECYYVEPNGADKAYSLLNEAMKKEACIGVGKAVIGTREQLFALMPMEAGISVQTLHFDAQVRAITMSRLAPVEEAELNMATMLVGAMKREFQPEIYRDESETKIKEAIQAKLNNQEIQTPEERISANNVIDLQEALAKSLEMAKSKEPVLVGAK